MLPAVCVSYGIIQSGAKVSWYGLSIVRRHVSCDFRTTLYIPYSKAQEMLPRKTAIYLRLPPYFNAVLKFISHE